jgi:hypothetical protein
MRWCSGSYLIARLLVYVQSAMQLVLGRCSHYCLESCDMKWSQLFVVSQKLKLQQSLGFNNFLLRQWRFHTKQRLLRTLRQLLICQLGLSRRVMALDGQVAVAVQLAAWQTRTND